MSDNAEGGIASVQAKGAQSDGLQKRHKATVGYLNDHVFTFVFMLLFFALVIVKTGIESVQAQESEDPLTVVRQGHCEEDDKYAIAVHGGAVFQRSNQDRNLSYVQSILTEAQKLLASGARGIDVVEAVIASMENIIPERKAKPRKKRGLVYSFG